jgi:hypothetical protein
MEQGLLLVATCWQTRRMVQRAERYEEQGPYKDQRIQTQAVRFTGTLVGSPLLSGLRRRAQRHPGGFQWPAPLHLPDQSSALGDQSLSGHGNRLEDTLWSASVILKQLDQLYEELLSQQGRPSEPGYRSLKRRLSEVRDQRDAVRALIEGTHVIESAT